LEVVYSYLSYKQAFSVDSKTTFALDEDDTEVLVVMQEIEGIQAERRFRRQEEGEAKERARRQSVI
jgi:hypothetical protein